MRSINFSYDTDQDDLLLHYASCQSKGSVEIGDLIIDYDSKNEFVGLQLMHASAFIKACCNENEIVIKTVLSTLQSARLETTKRNNLLIIKLVLVGKNKEISSVLTLPSITQENPALG
ncbi:MAG: DUF2283 domain-containing protein [archaeon]